MNIEAVKWGGGGLLILTLMASSAWLAWAWQANAYGQQLAAQQTAHQTALTDIANANSALILEEQRKRLALEQWLAASNQANYRVQTDAKNTQARLRDRLATAELRLSVLLDATDSARSNSLSATAASGRMVYGTQRAELDAAHAQRIISITGDGDQGLIALAACQGYVREIQKAVQ